MNNTTPKNNFLVGAKYDKGEEKELKKVGVCFIQIRSFAQ